MISIAYPHPAFRGSFDDLFFGHHHHRLLPARCSHGFHSAGVSQSEEGGYMLSVAAPGINASDITISCNEGVISFTGTSGSNGSRVHAHRSLSLPDDADVERATVTHENGLVHVNLPKKPIVEPRSIELAPFSDQPAPDASTHYRVALPAAGVAPRDLTITVLEREVKVSGRSKPHGVEYSIDRVLSIPRDADADNTVASLVDGILTLTVPKTDKVKQAKRLHIRSPEDGASSGCSGGCSRSITTDSGGCSRSVPDSAAASMDQGS